MIDCMKLCLAQNYGFRECGVEKYIISHFCKGNFRQFQWVSESNQAENTQKDYKKNKAMQQSVR